MFEGFYRLGILYNGCKGVLQMLNKIVHAVHGYIGSQTFLLRRSRPWLGMAVGLSMLAVGVAGGQEPTPPVCIVPADPNINIAVVRFNVDGTMDTTFGEG